MAALLATASANASIEFFIRLGADLGAENQESLTALWYAFQYGNQENIDLLLSHGTRADISNSSGNTLAMLATERNDIETLRHLTRKGADLHAVDKGGNSVLMYAVHSADQLDKIHDSWDATDYPLAWLLQQGVDPNQLNAKGQTVLMRAQRKGDERAVDTLMAHGVDV